MEEKRWRPSNGTEFLGFQENRCFYCKIADKEGYCDIIDRVLGGEYPKEWIYKNDMPHCKAFKCDEEKWARRNIIICNKCKKEFDKTKTVVMYGCFVNPDLEGITCAYYCPECLNELKIKQVGEDY